MERVALHTSAAAVARGVCARRRVGGGGGGSSSSSSSSSRRWSSTWAKLGKKSGRGGGEKAGAGAAQSAWQPPPRATGDGSAGSAVPASLSLGEEHTNTLAAVDKSMLKFDATPPSVPKDGLLVDRMAVRRADLPWPHVETPRSVQIAEVDGSAIGGLTFWAQRANEQELLEEESLLQTIFTWEDEVNPVASMMFDLEGNPVAHAPHVDYSQAFRFEEGNKLVKRSVQPARGEEGVSIWGNPAMRSATTEIVTIRTREIIPSNGVAFLEMRMLSSALHFGLGIVEADSFHPEKWIGYHDGSLAHYDDGRLGTASSSTHARKLKVNDDVGVLVYSPPEEEDCIVLFFKNEEPSGQPIRVKKNEKGWHFAITMVGYHYGGAACRISQSPAMAGLALKQLGKLLHPEDDDFHEEEKGELFESVVIQPFCRNRKNPYHICNARCRESSPIRLPETPTDHFGKPQPSNEVESKPSYLKWNANPGIKTAHKNGVWTFAWKDGYKVYKNHGIDIMKVNDRKDKASMTKAAPHNRGNMRFQ